MNILVSVNRKYLKHLRALLISMRDHMPEEQLDIYLLHKSLTQDETSKLISDMENGYDLNVYPIQVYDTPFDRLKLRGHFTIETMLRLVATDVLPETVERVLWLDSDIVICNDFSEFYNTDFDGAVIGACQENTTVFMDHGARLGLNEEHIYFNAGVLLMNLAEMRRRNVTKTFVEVMKQYDENLRYNDQDILNISFTGKDVKYFPSELYNCRVASNFGMLDTDYRKLMEECCILHYAARSKPWEVMYTNHVERNYWKYAIRDGRMAEFLTYLAVAPVKTFWMRYRMKKLYGVHYKRI